MAGTSEQRPRNKDAFYDFEDPRLSITDFVTDYFTWRLERENLEWKTRSELTNGPQPEHIAMRNMATIFEERHLDELTQSAQELLVDPHTFFHKYCEAMECFGNTDELSDGISYGKMVGLFAFGGVLAVEQARRENEQEITRIAIYTAKFIDKKIRTSWAADERSWDGFMQMAANISERQGLRKGAPVRRRETRRWSLLGGLAAAGVGAVTVLGAFTVGRALLSR